jgi:hypothetical protein
MSAVVRRMISDSPARSKWEGWEQSAINALVVAGIGIVEVYLGLDTLIAGGISALTEGILPIFILRPIIFGLSIGLTVFIWDLVVMYENEK